MITTIFSYFIIYHMYILLFVTDHRVPIERTSLSKETYTVKQPRKIFPVVNSDVFRGWVVGVNKQPHACVNTPENVTRLFLGVV